MLESIHTTELTFASPLLLPSELAADSTIVMLSESSAVGHDVDGGSVSESELAVNWTTVMPLEWSAVGHVLDWGPASGSELAVDWTTAMLSGCSAVDPVSGSVWTWSLASSR